MVLLRCQVAEDATATDMAPVLGLLPDLTEAGYGLRHIFWYEILRCDITGLLLTELCTVFQYTSQLETGHPKFPRREDLLWYFLFVGTVIIVGDPANFSPCFPVSTWIRFLCFFLSLIYLPG